MAIDKVQGSAPAHGVAPQAADRPQRKGTFSMRLEQPPAATPPAEPARPAGPLSPAPSPFEAGAKRMVTRILQDERAVDRGLAAAMSGKQLSSQELIVLQAKVIKYSQELEVASRLVEKATSAVKQIMTTQV